MQRSPLLTVIVHCGHHGRPVTARRNVAIDRLVACEESERCKVTSGSTVTFPQGCAVFPSLTKAPGS
jgi:hypothetical protein